MSTRSIPVDVPHAGNSGAAIGDFDNPAFVFVDQALELYETADGTAGKSCMDCHANVADFAGLKTSLPRVEDGELVTMTNLVNECRTERMGAEPWKYSGGQMSAMTALLAHQSRGMPMDVTIDGDAAPFWEKGKELTTPGRPPICRAQTAMRIITAS